MSKRIVVLVSGGGTNLQALIDAQQRGELGDGKITCVIASKADAYALTRAQNNGIKTRTLIRKDYNDIASYSCAMRDLLLEEKDDRISILKWEKERAERKVAELEKEIAELRQDIEKYKENEVNRV